MQVHYRFGVGTTLFFPAYEGGWAIKALRVFIAEAKKMGIDPSEFEDILVKISEENCRKQ